MNQLRAIFRLGAFFLWCVAAFTTVLCIQGVKLMAPALGVSMKRAVSKAWARGLCWIIGMRVEIQGEPPQPPFILVSNHLSYVDIATLMSAVPGVFVARADVAHWPLLGPLSRVANTVFVNRQSKKDVVRVNQGIEDVLASGDGLIMFPEGTSSRGREVMPFRSSLLQPAVSSGHPVSYASISYSTPPGSPPAEMSVCWWGDMTFGKHFWELLQLPSIEGSVSFGNRTLAAESRHELADSLQTAVSEGFRPVADAEAVDGLGAGSGTASGAGTATGSGTGADAGAEPV